MTLKHLYNILYKNIDENEEFVCRHDADLFYLLIKNRPVLEALELLYKIEADTNYFNKNRKIHTFKTISRYLHN